MCFFKYPEYPFDIILGTYYTSIQDWTNYLIMHYNSYFLVLNTYLYIISEEEIEREQFLTLTESMIRELIPKMGRRSSFYSKFVNFIENQVSKTIIRITTKNWISICIL